MLLQVTKRPPRASPATAALLAGSLYGVPDLVGAIGGDPLKFGRAEDRWAFSQVSSGQRSEDGTIFNLGALKQRAENPSRNVGSRLTGPLEPIASLSQSGRLGENVFLTATLTQLAVFRTVLNTPGSPSAVMKQIRVFFADDHVVVRRGLAALIGAEDDMVVVGEASNGEEALKVFRACQPDVTLMDLRLPGISGADTTRAIRAEFPSARIIVLTTYSADDDIRRAIEAGARGYLLKEALPTELLSAIRAVHQGRRSIPNDIAQRLADVMSRPSISDRELEVLSCMAKGLRNSEIATTLGISHETVKSHVKNILAKLDSIDRSQAVLTAIRRGLVVLEDTERR